MNRDANGEAENVSRVPMETLAILTLTNEKNEPRRNPTAVSTNHVWILCGTLPFTRRSVNSSLSVSNLYPFLCLLRVLPS